MAISFPALVYALCFLTSGACALLLAANNFLVIVDLAMLDDMDFRLARYLLALAAVGVLLFGFIWDLED